MLFDLGGVLIELDSRGPMRDLVEEMGAEAMWQRWLSCPWVRSFESGRCSPQVFAEGVVAEWGLSASAAEFLADFRRWPIGPLPGAEALVRDVAAAVDVGCLSNTNQLHWSDWEGNWSIFDLIRTRFLSFQIGLLKPDPEVFDHVVSTTGVEASRIVFLDDNQVNVEAAVTAGLQATRVTGVPAARQALEHIGVISPRR